MNAIQQAKLNMYNVVIALCNSNPTIIALIVAFSNSFTAFKTTVAAIVTAAAQLEAQTGGLAISKKTAKRSLSELGSGIAGLVFAYASSINDNDLKEAMHITASDIYNAKDDEVVNKCTNIHTTATAHLTALADFGVTATLLTTFLTAITDYNDKAPKPRLSVAQKKAIRAQVKQLFKDADTALVEQMDKTVVNFLNNGNADFYGTYHEARIIIDPGSFGTVLRILVLSKDTNMPIRNVQCREEGATTIKKSSNKGFITYKNPDEGKHTFRLRHKLFTDVEVEATISHNEKKTVTVLMNP